MPARHLVAHALCAISLLPEQPGVSPMLRKEQTRRRHNCRRGTQECARHNGFTALTGFANRSEMADFACAAASRRVFLMLRVTGSML